jgi:hypothetical protein
MSRKIIEWCLIMVCIILLFCGIVAQNPYIIVGMGFSLLYILLGKIGNPLNNDDDY